VSAKSIAVPAYLSPSMKQLVEELAEADGRSASSLLAKWIRERPEVQAKLNGGNA
jgi:hypothetical protein